MRTRWTRLLLPLLGASALTVSALGLAATSANAETCHAILNGYAGTLQCPNAPEPGYVLISSKEFFPHFFYGEGSSTYYRVECRNSNGQIWSKSGADANGFNGECPSNYPYIQMTQCGDGPLCSEPR